MVDIKFDSTFDPYSIGFTTTEDLENIYIPTHVMKNMTKYFLIRYGLSRQQAKRAAILYLEEIYPQVLAHESAHLALGNIAQEEGLPISETMEAYHNPIVDEIEHVIDSQAKRRAVAIAQAESRNLR